MSQHLLYGSPIEPYGTYFSGYPWFYPMIGGILDMLGGLELARLFSLLTMVGAGLCAYEIARKLFGQPCAIWAQILFAIQGSVLFIGRLATYDALCLFLIAVATVVAIHASTTVSPWKAGVMGPMLGLATVAKYAGMLFIPPLLLLLFWYTFQKQGWRRALLYTGLALGTLLAFFILFYFLMDKAAFAGIGFTTTQRVTFIRAKRTELLTKIILLNGIPLVLAFASMFLRKQAQNGSIEPEYQGKENASGLPVLWKQHAISLKGLLLGIALLTPLYHLYKGEVVSVEKHLAFSAFFMMPLAAYTVSRLVGEQDKVRSIVRWLSGLAICLIIFTLALPQVQRMYQGWANDGELVRLLQTQVRPGSGDYLIDDSSVCLYSLHDISNPWKWQNLYFFKYVDKHHQHLNGEEAYLAAIHERHFELIEMNVGFDSPLKQNLRAALKGNTDYEMIGRLRYQNSFGPGEFWVWRRSSAK